MGRHPATTPDEDREISDMYLSGLTLGQIARYFGFASDGIPKRVLRSAQIPARSASDYGPRSTKLDAAQEQSICAAYSGGAASRAIAVRFSIASDTVLRTLRRCGVRVRPADEAHRIYDCDHMFFDSIDTEPKAYWLGFLMADGNVTGNRLSLSLSACDGGHLRQFRAALRSDHPISVKHHSAPIMGRARRSSSEIHCLKICSDGLTNALKSHGCLPGKTFTLAWPRTVRDELMSHLVRGYFDGDGGFTAHPSAHGRSQPKFIIVCASPAFLVPCQEYLAERCHLPVLPLVASPTGSGKTLTLTWSGARQVSRLADFLYTDATTYLPRKRRRIDTLLSAPLSVPRGERVSTAKLRADMIPDVIKEYTHGVAPSRIAQRFGVTDGAIRSILHGKTWRHVTRSMDLDFTDRAPAVLRGDSHPRSKLTSEGVGEIKRLLEQGMHTSEIAERYGVGRSTIQNIASGNTWRHIP